MRIPAITVPGLIDFKKMSPMITTAMPIGRQRIAPFDCVRTKAKLWRIALRMSASFAIRSNRSDNVKQRIVPATNRAPA